MKVLNLKNGARKGNGGVEFSGIMGGPEFRQLLGNLDSLCVFATQTITEGASFIKTGARHSYAKYFLFPVKLRRKYRADEYDFEKLLCGTVEYRDRLFVVYGVPKKGLEAEAKTEGNGEE